MKPSGKGDRTPANSPADIWKDLIQGELKVGSKIGKTFEKAGFGGLEDKILTLYFEDEDLSKAAKGQIEPLKKKLPSGLKPCDRVDCKVGKVPAVTPKFSSSTASPQKSKATKLGNPLQALNYAEFGDDGKGNELSQPVLTAAVQTEKTCNLIYSKLRQRTEILAGGEANTISVSFNWRLRVGGTRGFRELLLPVFHPVFGVPYIPASSLKGAARAWARQNGKTKSEINKILGILDGKIAQAAKVEFLDAFPTKECLSVDVATPQWHWQNGNVAYKPEPHPLLSMEQPHFLIGLRPTKLENAKYIPVIKEWLENALKSGIGSRVSSGYGKALGQIATLPHNKSFEFQLWTQGLYGSEPPSKDNNWVGKPEFRPTAVRGILRYWFRAMAMSLYPPDICSSLEDSVFGKLSQQGKTNISVLFNPSTQQDPYRYDGRIMLEATEQQYLDLLQQLLILASHLGGVGRGSRRSLHRLNGRMRGCHWTIDGETLPLEYNAEQWKAMFSILKDKFKAINSTTGNYSINPGTPRPRYQDVLDANAQVWLVKSPGQLAPEQVKDWRQQGGRNTIRGQALTLLYSDDRFKGERELRDENGEKYRIGNPYVGGALEIPSFVWIKSTFPKNGDAYQVVTIFGVDQTDRLTFAKELDKLAKKKPSEALLIFGKMPNENSVSSNRPIRRQ